MATISLGALGTAGTLLYIAKPGPFRIVNGVIAIAIVVAAVIAVMALSRGGLPDWAGLQPEEAKAKGAAAIVPVYVATAISVPVIAVLLQRDGWAGKVLTVFGAIALAWLIMQMVSRPKVQRERLQVVLVLMFFSMLFWAFFEQAGSSVTNFTDRNVDRVDEERLLSQDDVGKTLALKLNQGQTGYTIPGFDIFTIDELDNFRSGKVKANVTEAMVGSTFTLLVKDKDENGKEVGKAKEKDLTISAEDIGKVKLFALNEKLVGQDLSGFGMLDTAKLEALKGGNLDLSLIHI